MRFVFYAVKDLLPLNAKAFPIKMICNFCKKEFYGLALMSDCVIPPFAFFSPKNKPPEKT